MRVLFDVNVILSLLNPQGEVLKTLKKLWQENSFQLVLSEDVLLELVETALEPRLQRLHKLSQEELTAFFAGLRRQANVEDVPKGKSYPSLRDPDDAAVLAAAENLRPDVIVTGDKDLLVLKNFEGIPILTPRQFLGRL